jgi:hypothetical protein
MIDIDALSLAHPEFVRSSRTSTSIFRVPRGTYTAANGSVRTKVITMIVFRAGTVALMGATALDEVAAFDMFLLETISPFFGAAAAVVAAPRANSAVDMSEVDDDDDDDDESSSDKDVEMTDISDDLLRLQIE